MRVTLLTVRHSATNQASWGNQLGRRLATATSCPIMDSELAAPEGVNGFLLIGYRSQAGTWIDAQRWRALFIGNSNVSHCHRMPCRFRSEIFIELRGYGPDNGAALLWHDKAITVEREQLARFTDG
jgi:hypothetical protein